jgi:hypothetical protein
MAFNTKRDRTTKHINECNLPGSVHSSMMTSSLSTAPFSPLSALPKVCTSLSSNLTLPSPTPSSFITPFKLTQARPCTTRTFSTYDSCQCGPGSHALPGGMVISVECRDGKVNVTRLPKSSTAMDSGDAFDICIGTRRWHPDTIYVVRSPPSPM